MQEKKSNIRMTEQRQEKEVLKAVVGRNFRETQKAVQELLLAHGIADAETDAWYLMEYVTGMNRTKFLLERQNQMEPAMQEKYLALAGRRAEHIPLQYLTGVQEFMGFEFRVNEHVLIPRQDTEILAEEAVKYLKNRETGQSGKTDRQTKVLDLCTGSGCIAVSLKKLCPGIAVTASDFSEEALEVAKENGKRLGADVSWIKSDLFESVEGTYDLIVSNPPYIRTDVIEELSDEVRLFEPRMALDGHEDGLFFYRRITERASDFLETGGCLMLEIGYDQGNEAAGMLAKNGFDEIKVLRDLAGLDRVVTGRLPEAKRKEENGHSSHHH